MTTPLDPAAAAEAFKKFLAETAQATVESLRKVAVDADARAQRQSAIADRLEATAGKDDARVVRLRQSSANSQRLARIQERTAVRMASDAVPQPRAFTFTGRVTDATGAVVPGVNVRLSDPTGAIRVAGSAVTDESGAFTLVVPPNTVDPNAANLSLVVEDSGNSVASVSPSPIQLKPGVLQRVDLTLAPPAPPAVDTTSGLASGAGGRRKVADRRKKPVT